MNITEWQNKLAGDVELQLQAHLPRLPVWPLTQLRSCQPLFVAATERFLGQLRTEAERMPLRPDPPEREVRRRHRVLRVIEVTQVLLGLRASAEEALNRAVVAHESAPAGKLLYSPEAHQAGAALSSAVTNLRTALTDSLTDGSELAREIRSLCGVGDALGGSPVDMRDLAQRQLLALRGPPPSADPEVSAQVEQAQQRRAYAEANGIDLEGYLEALEAGVAALHAALKRAPPQRVTSRDARDRAQLRLELTCLRIMASIHGALGLEARDALRDILPKAGYGQRRQDRKSEASESPASAAPTDAAAPRQTGAPAP